MRRETGERGRERGRGGRRGEKRGLQEEMPREKGGGRAKQGRLVISRVARDGTGSVCSTCEGGGES
jgi:hypothetical protein